MRYMHTPPMRVLHGYLRDIRIKDHATSYALHAMQLCAHNMDNLLTMRIILRKGPVPGVGGGLRAGAGGDELGPLHLSIKNYMEPISSLVLEAGKMLSTEGCRGNW